MHATQGGGACDGVFVFAADVLEVFGYDVVDDGAQLFCG